MTLEDLLISSVMGRFHSLKPFIQLLRMRFLFLLLLFVVACSLDDGILCIRASCVDVQVSVEIYDTMELEPAYSHNGDKEVEIASPSCWDVAFLCFTDC